MSNKTKKKGGYVSSNQARRQDRRFRYIKIAAAITKAFIAQGINYNRV